MIFVKDWRSIALYWPLVSGSFLDKEAPIWAELGELELLDPRVRKWVQLAKENIVRDVEHLATLLPSGELVNIDSSLLWVLEGDRSHDVDLYLGTIGSGYFQEYIESDDPSSIRLALEQRYGYLLGCPVLVREGEAERVFQKHIPWFEGGFRWDSTGPLRRRAGIGEGQAAPSRGRPKLYGGLVERMVQKQFGPRVAPGGDLAGEEKKIFVTALAIEWIKGLTDVVIKENTMRDYLAPLYPARPGGDGK